MCIDIFIAIYRWGGRQVFGGQIVLVLIAAILRHIRWWWHMHGHIILHHWIVSNRPSRAVIEAGLSVVRNEVPIHDLIRLLHRGELSVIMWIGVRRWHIVHLIIVLLSCIRGTLKRLRGKFELFQVMRVRGISIARTIVLVAIFWSWLCNCG